MEAKVQEPTTTDTPDKEKMDKHMLQEVEYIEETTQFYDDAIKEEESKEPFTPPTELDSPLKFYRSILEMSSKGSALNKYVNSFLEADKETKNEARIKLIACYWDFIETLFSEDFDHITLELRYLLRFGIIVTSAVSGNILQFIKTLNPEKEPTITMYYLDEWIEHVSSGDLNQTVIDETIISDEGLFQMETKKLDQLISQKDRFILDASALDQDIMHIFDTLISQMQDLKMRTITDFGFHTPLLKNQVQILRSIKEQLSIIQQKNEDVELKLSNINSNKINIERAQVYVAKLHSKVESSKDSPSQKKEKKKKRDIPINNRTIFDEMNAVKQMMKSSIGKRGNHFPFLLKDFFSGPLSVFGVRKHVLNSLREVEILDYSVFQRKIKGITSRFFPNILLGPCYSSEGICWEPFEMANRNNTSAKIVIPMYSQDLKKAIIRALGDYRWQFAKEKAGYNWMEEGLSGSYFMWHAENIKKGDVKAHFIDSYFSWIRWESTGAQKLDKELRFIFWKYVPFPYYLREHLAKKSPAYTNLFKREQNKRED